MKTKRRHEAIGRGIGEGVISGLAVTAVMISICTVMLNNEVLNEKSIVTVMIIINVISSSICGAVTKLTGKGSAINGVVSGIVYAAVFIIPMLIYDADTFEILRILLISMLFSFAFCRLNLVKSNKKFHKKTKIRN